MQSLSSFHLKYIKKIGIGGFSDVYLGRNQNTGHYYAIKKATSSSSQTQLQSEAQIYKILSGSVGFPASYFFGNQGNHNILILEYLGKTLQDLFEKCDKIFTLKTVLMIADQLLQRIEYFHSKGIIHKDIKPSNFLIGHGNKRHNIFLIDFGLSKPFQMIAPLETPFSNRDNKPISGHQTQNFFTIPNNSCINQFHIMSRKFYNENDPEIHIIRPKRINNDFYDENKLYKFSKVNFNNELFSINNNKLIVSKKDAPNQNDKLTFNSSQSKIMHIPMSFDNPIAGTLRFSSLNSNDGIEYSRRDDLESIGYILIYFLKGSLPWESIKADSLSDLVSKIAKKKREISLEELCSGIPEEFYLFMKAVRSLDFEDEPNYAEYRRMFRELFMKMNFIYDFDFDWLKIQKHKKEAHISQSKSDYQSNSNDDGTMKIYFSHFATPVIMKKNAAMQLLQMQKKRVIAPSKSSSGLSWLNVVTNIK